MLGRAVFVIALFLTLAFSPVHVARAATTLYVSPFPIGVVGVSCTLPSANSIQLAVTLANPGDTIIVCDGVYTETVTINKDLRLLGSGNAVIQAPAAPLTDLVTITGAVRVVMTQFIVSGPGNGGCGSIQAGIRVRDDATLDLSYTEIRDLRDAQFSGCQNGEAIRIGMRGDSSEPGHATLDNVIAVGFQKNGITVNGAGSTANIMNVTVRGAGETAVIAQNGIQVSRGASATISTSTIRDHIYGPSGTVACGLLIFDANGVNDDTNIYLNNEKDKCTFGGRGGTYEGMP